MNEDYKNKIEVNKRQISKRSIKMWPQECNTMDLRLKSKS